MKVKANLRWALGRIPGLLKLGRGALPARPVNIVGGAEQERTRWDPKDGELCLSRTKPEETLVEAPVSTTPATQSEGSINSDYSWLLLPNGTRIDGDLDDIRDITESEPLSMLPNTRENEPTREVQIGDDNDIIVPFHRSTCTKCKKHSYRQRTWPSTSRQNTAMCFCHSMCSLTHKPKPL
ncbi:unnamed protein product [Mytilus coruscus]|uniref:Uncharacterized protein n=1 Tax=Mytilus coruscus TaxID=42192 RepID=A0A6J8EDN9_MYTCO|nr:unnamed protein product [Mytilus coruscus]